MKKNFKYFGITWFLMFMLFNVITFITPNEIMGITRFDKPIFWIGYAFICVLLVAELVVFALACKSDDANKTFLNISYLKLSYIFNITSFFAGLIFMVIPVIPTIIGVIVCLLILALQIVSFMKIHAAIENVSAVSEKVETSTSMMRNLVAEAEVIVKLSTNNEIKDETTKVYEALRYSDYVSSLGLSNIEMEIFQSLKTLKYLVTESKVEEVKKCAQNILHLVEERKVKCKNSK